MKSTIASGADRELLAETVQKTVPDRAAMLQRLFENVDRSR